MKIAIVKFSELEPCWSAYRFTEMCFMCDKYFTCKHEVKVIDKEFERRTQEFMDAKKKYKAYIKRKFNGKLQHISTIVDKNVKLYNKEVTD